MIPHKKVTIVPPGGSKDDLSMKLSLFESSTRKKNPPYLSSLLPKAKLIDAWMLLENPEYGFTPAPDGTKL